MPPFSFGMKDVEGPALGGLATVRFWAGNSRKPLIDTLFLRYGKPPPFEALDPKGYWLERVGPNWPPKLEGGWEASSAADEYDSYLLHVASALRNGHEVDGLVQYLVGIETEHMGLSPSATTQSRAVATVRDLREYVDSLT